MCIVSGVRSYIKVKSHAFKEQRFITQAHTRKLGKFIKNNTTLRTIIYLIHV